MRSAIRYIGLDVHKDTVTIAQAIGDGEPVKVQVTDPAEDPSRGAGSAPPVQSTVKRIRVSPGGTGSNTWS